MILYFLIYFIITMHQVMSNIMAIITAAAAMQYHRLHGNYICLFKEVLLIILIVFTE